MADHVIYLLGPYTVPGFEGERNVRVYLPKEGAQAEPSPVLYVFDGQNIFHDDPSFAGGWHLHRAVRDLVEGSLVAPVLVGIDHGGSSRLDELSPFAGDGSAGKLDDFLAWITSDLVPLVQKQFGVRGDPAGTAIGGSSMGGLAALYSHFRRPDAFGGALCMSPSLWFAGEKIFDWLAGQPMPRSTRLYVDAGAQEDNGSVLRNGQRLVDHLRERGLGEGSLLWYPDEYGSHCEEAWRRRAPAALQFLFSGVVAPQVAEAQAQLEAHAQQEQAQQAELAA
jgi:predicted alpha/beta superfamily hydrolase